MPIELKVPEVGESITEVQIGPWKKQEGDTVASLSHDNVITVYACGVIDKHYYMAMEVLPGGDLAKKVEANTEDPQ